MAHVAKRPRLEAPAAGPSSTLSLSSTSSLLESTRKATKSTPRLRNLQREHEDSLRQSALRLKSNWEDICKRYGKDFGDEGDEIDLATGEVVVDRGHLRNLKEGGDDTWAAGDEDDLDDESGSDTSESGRRGMGDDEAEESDVDEVELEREAIDDLFDELGELTMSSPVKSKHPQIRGKDPEVQQAQEVQSTEEDEQSGSSQTITPKEGTVAVETAPSEPVPEDLRIQSVMKDLEKDNMTLPPLEEMPSEALLLEKFGKYGPALVTFLHQLTEVSAEVPPELDPVAQLTPASLYEENLTDLVSDDTQDETELSENQMDESVMFESMERDTVEILAETNPVDAAMLDAALEAALQLGATPSMSAEQLLDGMDAMEIASTHLPSEDPPIITERSLWSVDMGLSGEGFYDIFQEQLDEPFEEQFEGELEDFLEEPPLSVPATTPNELEVAVAEEEEGPTLVEVSAIKEEAEDGSDISSEAHDLEEHHLEENGPEVIETPPTEAEEQEQEEREALLESLVEECLDLECKQPEIEKPAIPEVIPVSEAISAPEVSTVLETATVMEEMDPNYIYGDIDDLTTISKPKAAVPITPKGRGLIKKKSMSTIKKAVLTSTAKRGRPKRKFSETETPPQPTPQSRKSVLKGKELERPSSVRPKQPQFVPSARKSQPRAPVSDKPKDFWSAEVDDPFYDPMWQGAHPDGEPQHQEFELRRRILEEHSSQQEQQEQEEEDETEEAKEAEEAEEEAPAAIKPSPKKKQKQQQQSTPQSKQPTPKMPPPKVPQKTPKQKFAHKTPQQKAPAPIEPAEDDLLLVTPSIVRVKKTPKSKASVAPVTPRVRELKTPKSRASKGKKEGTATIEKHSTPRSGKFLEYLQRKLLGEKNGIKTEDTEEGESISAVDPDTPMAKNQTGDQSLPGTPLQKIKNEYGLSDSEDELSREVWFVKDKDVEIVGTRKERKKRGRKPKEPAAKEPAPPLVIAEKTPIKSPVKPNMDGVKEEEPEPDRNPFATCGDPGYRCEKAICFSCIEDWG